jgi:hypothetical protein
VSGTRTLPFGFCAMTTERGSAKRSRMAKPSTTKPPGEVTMEGVKGVGQPHEPQEPQEPQTESPEEQIENVPT